ncbi:hypothetical protein ACQXY1_07620 [Corynebacterium diphtheriae]
MEYKKYIKAHNFMRFSHEDDDVVVEVTFFKISYWYFSGCYPNTYPSDLNSQITLLKDGVPAGKAEQSYRANGDSITIQPRFPALLAGKYTAILEGNLHTTKGVEKPLNSPEKWITLFLSIRAITNMLSPQARGW